MPNGEFDARPAPRPGALRTPEDRFEGIDDFRWPPRYHEVEPGLPGMKPREPLTPEALQEMLGIDWRATLGENDAIDPDKVNAYVKSGARLYFLAWRVYSQEVESFLPSRIVPGWCLKPVSAAALPASGADHRRRSRADKKRCRMERA